MTLTVKNLTHSFGHPDDALYKDVNMEFKPSTLYSIVGESGSGKTTFLSFIAGLDVPNSGDVEFDGKPIQKIGLVNYRKHDVAIVFQAYNLLNYMTALENVLSALSITESKHKGDKEYALQLLERVGIDKTLATKNVQKLSGGQQQRVAVVRALAVDAPVILADEPTGNLDSETSKGIISLFQEIAHKDDKTVIIVTHDDNVAAAADVKIRLADREFEIA
ncbi:MAG: ABC transporter ATP-binding protein [Lactobacillaceae bacterium]|jgi:putative ABC transport system ATP-binding protein|nr:ABC transporter ATP-binding protein [Lactobacillaceae bacterium]